MPTIEALEGRALLSVAGGPDTSYNAAMANYANPGFARVEFHPTGENGSGDTVTSQVAAEAVQSNGDDVVVGTDNLIGFSYGQVVGSTIEVTRLTTAGTVDTTFGTNGTVDLAAAGTSDTGQAVAIQSNGDIVVLANVAGPAAGIALYRLTPTGALDTTFGTDGVVDFEFGGTPVATSSASTLTILPSGAILVGGSTGTSIAFAQFTATGAADATFGTAGQSVFPASDSVLGVAATAVGADGSIDYDATETTDTGSEIVVGRLLADGSVDTAFGTAGQVTLGNTAASGFSAKDTAGAIAVASDGQIIVGGVFFSADSGITTSTTHFDVYRLNPDGSLDTTFGTAGEATPIVNTRSDFGSSGNEETDQVNSILIEANGTIVVGGEINYSEGELNSGIATIVGLNTDGTIDVDFGTTGQNRVEDGIGFDPDLVGADSVYGLALQPDGKILAATAVGVGRLLASGATNDFDNDGTSDPAVLMPNFVYPLFAFRPSSGGPDVYAYFGTPGAGNTLPAPGAYGGSGIDELAVYLPSIGAFGIRPYGTTGSQDQLIFIGATGAGNSIPASADYEGLGYTQVGVYEPAIATFIYATNNTSGSANEVSVPFGMPGAGNSIPVPDDYDGSGHDELAVYLPSIAAFVYRPYGTTGQDDTVEPFGAPGVGNSIPVPGDYDGSGHTELAVYLPAIGAFAYRPYGTTGNDDQVIPFGIPGAGNSIPVPGDYDGSGHTELAVYMPSLDAIAYRPYGTTGQDDQFIFFGEPGVGNTVPFNAQGAAYLQANSGGGGGGNGNAIMPKGPGWVDFVPTVAGQAKKGEGSIVTPSIAAMNQP